MQTGGGERSVSHHWEIVKCTYMCVHVHTHTHTQVRGTRVEGLGLGK